VQFPPREGNAAGKEVRNITIRATGGGDQSIKVGVTLWPSHAHVAVEEGDLIYVEGKFTRTTGEKKGEVVKYNNLSLSDIFVHGACDSGRNESEAASSAQATETDDDIPF
jgi:hypothetical protein